MQNVVSRCDSACISPFPVCVCVFVSSMSRELMFLEASNTKLKMGIVVLGGHSGGHLVPLCPLSS